MHRRPRRTLVPRPHREVRPLPRQRGRRCQLHRLPVDLAPADITDALADELLKQKQQGPRSIGTHPVEQLPIYALLGPFGPYLQLGDAVEGAPKPKRVSLPR
ncbi:MAG: topoisomerase C-terminal repeat-containing protein, partial [Planctomycetaceae bacterium]